jgi:hypothetical protein
MIPDRNLRDQRLWLKSAAILAMQESPEGLSEMLASPDADVRNQAMLYAAYNPSLAEYLNKNSRANRFPEVNSYLARQRELREELERIGTKVPVVARGIAFSMLGGIREASLAVADEIPDISPGLRMWLADRIDDLEGQTVDHEELDLDNSPPPSRNSSL